MVEGGGERRKRLLANATILKRPLIFSLRGRLLKGRGFFSRLCRSWLRPTAEDVSAFGGHRKFSPHARKTSVTQGSKQPILSDL